MIFNTLAYYFAFLLPTAGLVRWAPERWRTKIIVLSGSLFFLYFGYAEAGRIAGSACLIIFLWESCFSRLYRPGSVFCIIGVVQALLLLGVFKYWNFLISLVLGMHAERLVWRSAFLPLGISFFTFEFIHFAVDRYRGRTEAGGFWEYFSFILFFPTMVAGPIKRYQDFLPKLRAIENDWALDWHCGITRILTGLAKKLVVADMMTSLTGNLNQAAIATAQRPMLLVWLLAYGVQIYFDFSAYSDIAIGSARLMGVRIPENFNWPYLAQSISEFWQHWHISLTRWLIDYIYIPLGGSRMKPPRIIANLLVTMLLSGIWHGAGLNFLVWGAWHGVLLSIRRIFLFFKPSGFPDTPGFNVLSWAVTFCAVNLGWAFFCMDISTAVFFFRRLLWVHG
jgi:alginate O-acetyltransferase complex protein AlgI